MMRHFTRQREPVRPTKTRFATAFITLSCLHEQKNNLRKMFTSADWSESKLVNEQKGKNVAKLVIMHSFWYTIIFCLKISSPLVRVFRLVDGEKKAHKGYIYEAMTRAKEPIVKSFLGNEEKYKKIFKIIDRRWKIQLHQPLHATRYFLNPEVFYDKPKLDHDEAMMRQLYKCIERMIKDVDTLEKVVDELSIYIKAK